MRALLPAFAAASLLAASGAAPAAVTGSPPVTVLQALPGKTPSPATGQEAVALARANENVPGALARPYKAELGWTAQWQGGEWWLVGVFESDWGTRFVVRAAVEGRYVKFGVGPTRQWILDNAQPRVTTLYTRFDPSSAVSQMQAELLAVPPPPPNSFPDFNPANYKLLDGAAELVRDAPATKSEVGPFSTGPGWYFVYYARDLRSGRNVVLPVAGLNYSPVSEGAIETAPGVTAYGLSGSVWDNVPPWEPGLQGWITSVVAARDWKPTNWPSTGHDPSFTVPPIFHRPLPVTVAKRLPGTKPNPARGRAAVAFARAGFDVVDALAEPFVRELRWTAQWKGKEWWLVGAFSSQWGKRFVVRATVVGQHVRFGEGPTRRWIAKHVRPRWTRAFYTRLKPVSATGLMQAEMLALPPPTAASVSQFDPANYSILAGAAELVRDAPPTVDSGPRWYFVFYAKDLATGRNVVLPVTSSSLGPLVERTYETSTPGSTAYGFEGFDVLLKVPSHPQAVRTWIRSVVAKRGWHPTNLR